MRTATFTRDPISLTFRRNYNEGYVEYARQLNALADMMPDVKGAMNAVTGGNTLDPDELRLGVVYAFLEMSCLLLSASGFEVAECNFEGGKPSPATLYALYQGFSQDDEGLWKTPKGDTRESAATVLDALNKPFAPPLDAPAKTLGTIDPNLNAVAPSEATS